MENPTFDWWVNPALKSGENHTDENPKLFTVSVASRRQRRHFAAARFGGFAAPASLRGAALHFFRGYSSFTVTSRSSWPLTNVKCSLWVAFF